MPEALVQNGARFAYNLHTPSHVLWITSRWLTTPNTRQCCISSCYTTGLDTLTTQKSPYMFNMYASIFSLLLVESTDEEPSDTEGWLHKNSQTLHMKHTAFIYIGSIIYHKNI
jgi:hypothetical protein